MVALARKNLDGSVAFEGDFVQTILRQRGLPLGQLNAWLEPKPLTDDERRAISATRLPADDELMLTATGIEPTE